MKVGGLHARMARALGITAALSVAGTAFITFFLVRQYAEHQALQQLQRQAQAVVADAAEREQLGTSVGRALPAALDQLLSGSGDHFAFVCQPIVPACPANGIISNKDAVAASIVRAVDSQSVLAGHSIRGTVHVHAGEFAYVAKPVVRRGQPPFVVYAVVLGRPVGLAATVWRPILGRVLIAGAVAVLVAVAASLLIARRLAGPLRRMADATRGLAAGDLSHRVPVEGDGEVADLARQFNDMGEALSEARRREHEFLANVSHELKSPLTAIRGYAEALVDGTAKDEGARDDAVRVIHDEADRLELLLRDVMDLARLGAEELRLEPQAVTLDGTLREAVAAHAARAAGVGISLTDDSDSRLAAATVVTDPLRVRQIVSNLVDNALRVTPAGGAIRVAGRPAAGEIVIEVADTGPGIAPADLPHVFERSYLWGKSQGATPVGTGLGLAIVRDLAVALRGRVEVESELGKGTRFTLHLPTG